MFAYVQATRGVGFLEAVEHLARDAGIDIARDPATARRAAERKQRIGLVQAAARHYTDTLRRGEDAGPARAWLRSLGFDGDAVADWQIGYAPTGDSACRLLRSQGAEPADIRTVGVGSRSLRHGLVDHMEGLVVFPTTDRHGDPVGFIGVEVGDPEPVRYTPKTPIHHGDRHLYGLDRARVGIIRARAALLLESPVDVAVCHRRGVATAVAPAHPRPTSAHMSTIASLDADVVVPVRGADTASVLPYLRAAGGAKVRVAEVADDSSVAELANAASNGALLAALDTADDAYRHLIRQALTAGDKQHSIDRAVQVIALHPDPKIRAGYVSTVARQHARSAAEVAAKLDKVMSSRAGALSL